MKCIKLLLTNLTIDEQDPSLCEAIYSDPDQSAILSVLWQSDSIPDSMTICWSESELISISKLLTKFNRKQSGGDRK